MGPPTLERWGRGCPLFAGSVVPVLEWVPLRVQRPEDDSSNTPSPRPPFSWAPRSGFGPGTRGRLPDGPGRFRVKGPPRLAPPLSRTGPLVEDHPLIDPSGPSHHGSSNLSCTRAPRSREGSPVSHSPLSTSEPLGVPSRGYGEGPRCTSGPPEPRLRTPRARPLVATPLLSKNQSLTNARSPPADGRRNEPLVPEEPLCPNIEFRLGHRKRCLGSPRPGSVPSGPYETDLYLVDDRQSASRRLWLDGAHRRHGLRPRRPPTPGSYPLLRRASRTPPGPPPRRLLPDLSSRTERRSRSRSRSRSRLRLRLRRSRLLTTRRCRRLGRAGRLRTLSSSDQGLPFVSSGFQCQPGTGVTGVPTRRDSGSKERTTDPFYR